MSEGVDERVEEESLRTEEESVSEGRSKYYHVENCRFTCTYVPGIPTSLPNTIDFLRMINAAAGESIDQQTSLLALVCGEDHSFTHPLDECVKLLLEYDPPLPTTSPYSYSWIYFLPPPACCQGPLCSGQVRQGNLRVSIQGCLLRHCHSVQ